MDVVSYLVEGHTDGLESLPNFVGPDQCECLFASLDAKPRQIVAEADIVPLGESLHGAPPFMLSRFGAGLP